MSVTIHGIRVDDPTAVWTQLKATREELNPRSKWNSGGWFNQEAYGKAYTMCLANAVRFVVKGRKAKPDNFSRDTQNMVVAEKLVLYAINHRRGNRGQQLYEQYSDIPGFNDEKGRAHSEILAVIDEAIELVASFARRHAVVIAHEVMTEEERRETREAVRKAEQEMWEERFPRRMKDSNGIWRDVKGRFTSAPKLNNDWPILVHEPEPAIEQSKAMTEFRRWLNSHQQRGWGTFWDELAECDEDDLECQEAAKALAQL